MLSRRTNTVAGTISGILLGWNVISTPVGLCNAWTVVGPRIARASESIFHPLLSGIGSNRIKRAEFPCQRHCLVGRNIRRQRSTRRVHQSSSMSTAGSSPEAEEIIRRIDTRDVAETLVSKYENFIFDCDGVLWGGSHAIDGSLDTVKALRRAGKRTFFVTNNSSKSRRQYCIKLEGFGVQGVGVEDIVTSGSAIAAYVRLTHPDVSTVYMIGEDGLEEELGMVGLKVVKEAHRPPLGMTEDEFREGVQDPEVGAVVVGLDTSFGFRQMCMASAYIQKGAHFLGTNPDVADRVGSLLMPGTGPILSSIRTASGVGPIVVGKPNPLLIRQLMELNGLEPSRTLMVGDRLDTDIMFGNAGGVSSALVLTGVSEMSDVVGLKPGGASTPNYLLEKLGVLLPAAEVAAAATEATAPAAKI